MMLCKELQDTHIANTMQQNAALTLLDGAEYCQCCCCVAAASLVDARELNAAAA
jgi:hypothetical protein